MRKRRRLSGTEEEEGKGEEEEEEEEGVGFVSLGLALRALLGALTLHGGQTLLGDWHVWALGCLLTSTPHVPA